MHKLNFSKLLLAFTFLTIGCRDSILDDDLPEVDGNVKLNIVAHYIKPSSPNFESDYIFSEAMTALKDISFIEASEDKNTPDFPGSFQCDLTENTTTPSLPYGNIKTAIFHEVQVGISNELESDKSVVISGNYHPNSVFIHPFTFSSDVAETITVFDEQGINITNEKLHEVSIIIDLAYVFDGVDFENVHFEKDGSIDFNNDENKAFHALIEERILESFRLYQIK